MRKAGAWLAKKDRGFTRQEEIDFDEWQRADPTHVTAVAQLSRTMAAFDCMGGLTTTFSSVPDPDVFAPRWKQPQKRWFRPALASLGAAAAIAFILFQLWLPTVPAIQRYSTPVGSAQKVALVDGSVLVLNGGTEVEVEFLSAGRHVRLARGEASFQVARNPDRPFIVTANSVSVRAVGTAFNVRMDSEAVEVLVTEGKVKVSLSSEKIATTNSPSEDADPSVGDFPILEAGDRLVVPFALDAARPRIAAVTPAEIEHRLAWQPRVLELKGTPLSEIVAEFNRRATAGGPRIILGDPDLKSMRIGGSFRTDQADAFIRLLENSFDITVERSGDTITLRCRH